MNTKDLYILHNDVTLLCFYPEYKLFNVIMLCKVSQQGHRQRFTRGLYNQEL